MLIAVVLLRKSLGSNVPDSVVGKSSTVRSRLVGITRPPPQFLSDGFGDGADSRGRAFHSDVQFELPFPPGTALELLILVKSLDFAILLLVGGLVNSTPRATVSRRDRRRGIRFPSRPGRRLLNSRLRRDDCTHTYGDD